MVTNGKLSFFFSFCVFQIRICITNVFSIYIIFLSKVTLAKILAHSLDSALNQLSTILFLILIYILLLYYFLKNIFILII